MKEDDYVVHELKIWPSYFEAVLNGTKTFEIRKDDRQFSVGDILVLMEYEPGVIDYSVVPEVIKESRYTGRVINKEISYIFKGGMPRCGFRKDYAIIGLKQEGIQLTNIDLTGISEDEQWEKMCEEENEFAEAYFQYMNNKTSENKSHVIEGLFDEFQCKLGLLEKEGITAEEVMKEYPKHLEKLKNRPRKEELNE